MTLHLIINNVMYQLQTKTVTLNLHILNLFYLIYNFLDIVARYKIKHHHMLLTYVAFKNSDCALANGNEAYCVGEKTLFNE